MTAYAYDASKPHRLTGATIGGKTHEFAHDADGNMIERECTARTGCGDDRHIEWNGRNLPRRITAGESRTDATPTSRDEFAYVPDGSRYHRKTTHMDGEALRTEHTYHVGPFEELLPRSGAAHASIKQTRVTDAVRHVKTTTAGTDDDGKATTTTAEYVDYIHKDHLGSAEAVTGADGAPTRTLAYDPFGGRRKADWTAALTPAEISALAGSSDPRERGHTGHEHLDRAGLIHRGGRIYDPALGRFLSPDPLVGNPGSAQSWNAYSYVSNSPMSFVDPSGLSQAPARPGCVMIGFSCQQQGGGGASGGGFVAEIAKRIRVKPKPKPEPEKRAKGPPKPAPNFKPPTNPPSKPPVDLPEGHKVRVMPPTQQYPNGYWRQYNEYGQAVNPATGKPPSNVARIDFRAQTHVPLPPP